MSYHIVISASHILTIAKSPNLKRTKQRKNRKFIVHFSQLSIVNFWTYWCFELNRWNHWINQTIEGLSNRQLRNWTIQSLEHQNFNYSHLEIIWICLISNQFIPIVQNIHIRDFSFIILLKSMIQNSLPKIIKMKIP